MRQDLENIKPTPVLVSRFFDIREKPEINPTINDFSDVFSDERYRQHTFEEAKKSFEFIFNKEKFIRNIQLETNKKSFSYLKEVRRYGLILRAIYKFIDPSHKCAENLKQFLSLLGKYNDSYKVSPSGKVRIEIINNLDNIEFPINFVDTSEFKRYATNILSDIETFLNEEELPVDEFHTLRKRLRLFADLMQVAAAENYKGNLHWLFYSIIKLCSEMGEHHDYLVQKGLNGEISYHKSTIKVSSHMVSEFKKLKSFIEKVCGLTEKKGK